MKQILLSTVAVIALSSAASAADLYAEPAPVVPDLSYAAPAPQWTGVYVGVQGGYGFTNYDFGLEADDGAGGTLTDSTDVDADGGIVGVNVGADFQAGSWVFGIMADYNWAGIEGDFSEDNLFGAGAVAEGTVEQESIWNVLARVGYLINPQTLVYALGGYSESDVELEFFNGTDTEGGEDTLQGWTVGIGTEVLLTNNVSVKGEYRYTAWDDSGFDFTVPTGAGSADVETDQHSLLVGLNFRWP